MNNRWQNMSPVTETALKLATIKWPNGKAGLFRIGTDNRVRYRYFDGSSWLSWQVLPTGSAIDISAVVWPNGQADVFRVDGNQCDVYVSHSTDGQTWGAWNWWGSCGNQIAVSVMPNGTAWAMLRVPTAGNIPAMLYFNGTSWAGSWTALPGTQLALNDIDLLAYPNPGSTSKMAFWGIGANDCGLYFRDWNGTSWTNWTLAATCYKQVSSFSTYSSDGGAYMLLIRSDNRLSTNRFTGSAWLGIMPPGTTTTWLAAAGVNVDDDTGNVYEHTQSADDCRVQHYSYGPICDSNQNRFYTQGVNLAEIIEFIRNKLASYFQAAFAHLDTEIV
jgi:hypothetical protein